MRYGIAYTADGGHPDGGSRIVSWKQLSGADDVYELYTDALEACDHDGWRGYVRVYPSGEKVTTEQ